MRLAALAGCLLVALAPHAGADRAFDREIYAFWTPGMTFQELADAGVTYASHVPANPETIAEAHRWGIRVLPYVSVAKVYDSRENPYVEDDPFMSEVDLAEHPGWVLLGEDGQPRRPFDDPSYTAGIHLACYNHPGVAEAYVRGVENVLALGADGVFIDNVSGMQVPWIDCHGAELGLHEHLHPDNTNYELYREVLRAVYAAVKAHGPDYAVMLNCVGDPDFADAGDMLMWESFVFAPGAPAPGRGDPLVAGRFLDWGGLVTAYETRLSYTSSGGSVAPLPGMPTLEGERDHLFLTYACARLAGFHQWCPARGQPDMIRQLLRADLGLPVGPLRGEGLLLIRQYERGLVVGNPGTSSTRARVPWQLGDGRVADLYSGRLLTAHGGTVGVRLPPDSGRVYVTRQAYLANCLGEVAGATTASSLRAARMADQGRIAPQAAAEAQHMLDAADRTARALRARALAGDLTSDAQVRAQVARLTTALDPLLHIGGAAGVEPLIIGGFATALHEVEAALQGDRPRGLGVVVAPAGVALSSGGATYKFATEPAGAWFIFHQDEASIELGLSARVSAPGGQPRKLLARRIEDIELLRDDDEAKTARFVVRLADAEAGGEADDVDVLVTAAVRRDRPWLRVESALRNRTGGPVRASWHWSVSAPWCTDASGGPWRPAADRAVSGAWLYAHRRQTGGGGVVLADWTALRPAHGELLLEPAVAPAELADAGESRCAWSTAFAAPTWQEDDFLNTRLRWYEQYASLAAQAATGARLVLRAPGQCVAGVPARVRVALIRPDGPESQAGEIGLRALLADEELPVGVDGATPGRGVFAVDVPAGASGLLELRAMASVEADGVPVVLRSFEAMAVRPAVELIDVRHCPTPSGELGVVVRLRNHLARVLPVTLDLAVAEPPLTHTTQALLPDQSVTSVTIEPPGVPIPERASVEATMSVAWESAGVGGRLDHPAVVPLLPTALCEITDSAPLVDGVLDDACWQRASRIEGLPNFRSGEPPGEPTTCLLAADPGGLSIAFVCDEAEPAALVTDAVANAWGLSPDVTRDDSVEIHLDPRVWGQRLLRLVLNSRATAQCTRATGWQAATTVGDGRWVVEVRLPAEVVGAAPREGSVWGLGLARNDSSSEEISAWSPARGWWANPRQFGSVRFVRRPGA